MHHLKRMGQNIVPLGHYSDPAALDAALRTWLSDSLTPLLCELEKSIINEFKLIPQMLNYDVCLNGEWHKETKTIASIREIAEDTISRRGPDRFELQIVVDCFHPHVTWGSIVDIVMEDFDVELDGEVFTCKGIVMDPIRFNLDEPLPLSAALALIEDVLIELRINYVQNT